MIRQELAFALEGVTSGELLLFAAFLLSNRRRSPTLRVLAGLSGTMAAMIGANLANSLLDWQPLRDFVLVCDLIAPALLFLYVRQIRQSPARMSATDLVHALPALIGFAAWESGQFSSMDIYVIACWTLYLAASTFVYAREYDRYAPAGLKAFIALLLLVVMVITVLRVIIVLQAGAGISFLQGTPYVLVLTAVFLLTSWLLFSSLHYPNLLTNPSSYVKYARSGASALETQSLEQRFAQLVDEQKAYLNPSLSVAELALMAGVPARQLSQYVNSQFLMNVPAYLNKCRVREAARILREAPDKPIKVVMFEAGFASKNLFHREFQRNMGRSPTAFRQSMQI
ncbi:MAG TPA: helix-turn-helix domain-containing protein [Rhizomicrobium sp.]|jgi:AraC-like DNA-binding protein|nr:helix-turn-helix domain-containing protein [Rhizomicrobium sp.]